MADTEASLRPAAEPDRARRPTDGGEAPADGSPSRSGDGTPPASAARVVPEDQAGLLPRGFQAVLTVASAVAVPPALITGLAYFFAVKRQETLALYFGVDTSVLGYSTQDYLLRGGDVLFVVVLFVALAGLGFARAHLVVLQRLDVPRLQVPFRWMVVALKAVGLALLVLGLVAVFRPLPFSPHFLFRSLSFGMGVVLIAYGTYLGNRLGGIRTASQGDAAALWLSPVSLVLVVVVAFLSLFWATKDLAQALGNGQAQQLERSIAQRPGVVVYCNRDPGIEGPGVIREELDVDADSYRYQYRYSGLRLLVRSGGRYFVVPAKWSRSEGAVMLLSDDESMRVEFTPGGRG
jgi:hypothetical protein